MVFRWIAANTLAWSLAYGTVLFPDSKHARSWPEHVLLGAGCGAIVGVVQWLPLRRRPGSPLTWIAGACLGSMTWVWTFHAGLQDLGFFTLLVAGALSAAAVQLPLLWRRTARPALWLVAATAGGVAGSIAALWTVFQIGGFTIGDPTEFFAGGAAGGLVFGSSSPPVPGMDAPRAPRAPRRHGPEWPRPGEPHMTYASMQRLCAVALALVVSGGCSIKRIAVNKIGNALASGGSTYESDDDLELVGDALPFGLKLMESLLAESPRHRGLLHRMKMKVSLLWIAAKAPAWTGVRNSLFIAGEAGL